MKDTLFALFFRCGLLLFISFAVLLSAKAEPERNKVSGQIKEQSASDQYEIDLLRQLESSRLDYIIYPDEIVRKRHALEIGFTQDGLESRLANKISQKKAS